MTTEIDGVQDLLEQLDPKNPLDGLEWEIVDNSERAVTANKYLDDPITRALLDDKTVRVKGLTRADKYRRWATPNGYKLNVKHRGNYTFLWVEKREDAAKSNG